MKTMTCHNSHLAFPRISIFRKFYDVKEIYLFYLCKLFLEVAFSHEGNLPLEANLFLRCSSGNNRFSDLTCLKVGALYNNHFPVYSSLSSCEQGSKVLSSQFRSYSEVVSFARTMIIHHEAFKTFSPLSSAMAPLMSRQASGPTFAPASLAASRSSMLTLPSSLEVDVGLNSGCSTAHSATFANSLLFSRAWPRTCIGCADRNATDKDQRAHLQQKGWLLLLITLSLY